MYTILSISDSDKHRNSAIQEYEKRLGKMVCIENIKPAKNGSQEQIIKQDTENIIQILNKKYQQHYKILMSKDGKLLTTEELEKTVHKQNHVVFIIGGPYGLQENQLDSITNEKIGLGKITLPHGLAKLTLIEQIYRCETIRSGKSYHY
ncbi:MAG: 23S rRNA (pseudouridine(1915)-N(3))-methyltransferase RlmH [Candidatus Absconditabacteria bacterium]|nr:23S rRNA (pseudouridine(1915)-N(3))-methyltransferase RlmH [Candidatus Absconditabacteria bacterium]